MRHGLAVARPVGFEAIVAHDSGKPPARGARRVAHIVHDDRGNAQVEWQEIPDDRTGNFARPSLELEDFQGPKSTNPYQRVETAGKPDPGPTSNTRRDLRKLSEWIKLKREVAARKLRGDDENDEK